MSVSVHGSCGSLAPLEELLRARPLRDLGAAREALALEGKWWGYEARPAAIRWLYRPREEWLQILGEETLVEARIFRAEVDIHWLDGRGVVIEEVSEEGREAELPPGAVYLGGDDWMVRQRRSRLWGEDLEGSDVWYEEMIPDPLRYEGIAAGPDQRYIFLRYREYVHEGAVRFVRFLKLEGGSR